MPKTTPVSPQPSSDAKTSAPVDKSLLPAGAPVTPPDPRIDVVAFRKTDEGKKLAAWANAEFTRCKTLKLPKQRQWYQNLAMVFGNQWLQVATGSSAAVAGKLSVSPAPRWLRRKTVNRLRSYFRTEMSKFLSTLPDIVAVPATAEDEDVRAAYAAEQVWTSYSENKRFRRQYSAAIWWMIMTGNGFIKTWWDPECVVEVGDGNTDNGDVEFRKVTPFNIFVPEAREADIDSQPYVIEARVRTLDWAKSFYSEQLKDVKLSPSTSSTNTVMDEGYLNLQNATNNLDSVIVYEYWVRPGMTQILPKGGFFVMVEDTLVDYYEGLPYTHGQVPYTPIQHLFNDTFWADSPLVDLIPLQREYNELRTDISTAGRRMGNPQLLVAKGSVVPGKMTNEPGAMIEYRPGLPAPTPAPLANLPQYVVDQQDRILADFEDISGQHDVSKGQAPTGVTAGTALSYLGERDDNYLTPQYQGIEDANERIAKQTLQLFQQYVDIPRKIRVVGLDGAFDTMLLSQADIKGGTDVRVEPGSGIGQSQAAKRAQVMDLVSLQLIDGPTALKMMEIGGPQKVLDIVDAASRKAQRENMKMKALQPESIQMLRQEQVQWMQQELAIDPNDQMALMELQAFMAQEYPPVIQVDDFDLHEVHIEVHNRFRMSQEYETLPQAVKDQFEQHVKWHQQMGGQQMAQQLMAQAPPDVQNPQPDTSGAPAVPGSDQHGAPGGMMAPTPGPGPAA